MDIGRLAPDKGIHSPACSPPSPSASAPGRGFSACIPHPQLLDHYRRRRPPAPSRSWSTRAGTLVPPGDAGALADAAIHILQDEQGQPARAAAARAAAERFSWQQITNDVLDRYQHHLDSDRVTARRLRSRPASAPRAVRAS